MATATGDSAVEPIFALRGLKGTWIRSLHTDRRIELAPSRVFTFSDDGSLFAMCDGHSVKVFSGDNFVDPVFEIIRPRTAELQFSPLNNLLALWEPSYSAEHPVRQSQYITYMESFVFQGTKDPNSTVPPPNLQIYDWRKNKLVYEGIQKRQQDWCPEWSCDEAICSRNVNNEILFYENNNFTEVKCKLHMAKIGNYSLARSQSAPYHVAVYVPGSKGQPSYVRLYRYPNFGGPSAAIANKSFYKSDRTELFWNRAGTAVLILTSSETSAESYYGEQQLHFISIKEESCLVPRPKNGPIYDISWNPNSKVFCVVYGYMPAKATLYDLKCDPVFDFGTGPRNLAIFNPHGNMLCLAGFGNLRGNLEFWDLVKQRLVHKFEATDTTQFEWCPDGVHFITATLTPRLRVGNGYKVYHYSGTLVCSWSQDELYDITWRSALPGVYPEQKIQLTMTQALAATQAAAAKPAAYVPPAMRNLPPPAVSKPKYREDYEPPSNLKNVENKPLSKSAEKNKKKRENKKKKRAEQEKQGTENNATAEDDASDG